MAYVYPNTDIKLLHNVYLQPDYEHTIYFQNKQLQQEFFNNNLRVLYTLTNQQYQRKERGWLKVNLNQNQVLGCNYMIFKNNNYTLSPTENTGTSTRWYYCFITDVEYVNENNTLIKFEIDVMQTYMFDYTLEACFVEREHTTTDNLFENLVTEDLDIGDDLNVQVKRNYDLNPCCVAVIYTSELYTTAGGQIEILTSAEPKKIGNYFTGLGLKCFDLSSSHQDYGLDAFGDFLDMYVTGGFEDAIVNIYQYPQFMGLTFGVTVQAPYTTVSWDLNSEFRPFVNIDGYAPKNKKLFNYPYNFIKLTNNKGSDTVLKFEQWDTQNDIGKFEIAGVPFGEPTAMCYPLYYREIPKDYENGLVYKGFNQCGWTGDAYQVWLAQNRENNDLAFKLGAGALLVGGALFAGGTLATGGALPMLTLPAAAPVLIGAGNLLGPAAGNVMQMTPVGGGSIDIGSRMIQGGTASIAATALNAIRTKNKLEATPRPAHGHITNDVLNMQMGLCGYTCYQMTIRNEYAKIIDEYFSRYGYACHRVKIPNRNARQHWTYTKTIGCELQGNLPANILEQIKSIYDKGITFWNDGLEVGNYIGYLFENPVYPTTT